MMPVGESQGRNTKHQTPNPKELPNSKSQAPNPKAKGGQTAGRHADFEVGVWCFFGIGVWWLEFVPGSYN
jgi:hypothetical protein